MKVLEVGSDVAFFSVETVCSGNARTNENQLGGCGSKLLVEIDDMYFHSVSAGHGSREEFIVYACGHCGTLNKLEPDNWPPQPDKLKECRHTIRERNANSQVDPY